MSAASNNLTSVTLELGGKNHTIVDESANIKDSAEKIIWTKALNCGQTCIACNHIFVDKKIAEKFYTHLEKMNHWKNTLYHLAFPAASSHQRSPSKLYLQQLSKFFEGAKGQSSCQGRKDLDERSRSIGIEQRKCFAHEF